jgi:hypothetical protein
MDIFLALFETLGSVGHLIVAFTKCCDMDIYEEI